VSRCLICGLPLPCRDHPARPNLSFAGGSHFEPNPEYGRAEKVREITPQEDEIAASLTIHRADKMTTVGRKAIANWLREHAKALEKYGHEYSPRFRGSYRYR